MQNAAIDREAVRGGPFDQTTVYFHRRGGNTRQASYPGNLLTQIFR